MARRVFVSIVEQPPPDCAHCHRPTVLPGTPPEFRTEDTRAWSGCRGLCSSCYSYFRDRNPEGLADYPRTTYRILDLREEFETLGLSKREAARVLGIPFATLERALLRAHHLTKGVAA